MAAAVALGILIGLISAVPFVVSLRIGYRLLTAQEVSTASLSRLSASVLSLPTFWFGGPWLSSKVMTVLDWSDLAEPYIVSLASVFVLLSIVLVILLIARTAQTMSLGAATLPGENR